MKPINQGLVDRALANLKTRFNSFDHYPSDAQWAALTDLLNCLDKMALGTADSTVYLSSLDPGLGKTTALKCYLDQLLSQSSKPYAEVGCLICLNTLSEVERLIDDVAIPLDMLGVWTSNNDLNSRGRPDRENAKVLITTHARVLMEISGKEFWATDSLHFRGQVRQFRVWDEEFLPGLPISLSYNSVASTLKYLQTISAELRNSVKAAFDEVEKLNDRSVYVVPDFMNDTGSNLDDLLGSISRLRGKSSISNEIEAAMRALNAISGRKVVVRKDNPEGNACVDYQDTIPSDLVPILVLDASGRPGVRVLYQDMQRNRGMVTPLKSAAKSYRNLTTHVWRKGGGKAAWARPQAAKDMLDGIAATIRQKPQEDWLIIHHKADLDRGIPDVASELKRRLNVTTFDRVNFRTWGLHKATNEFAHIHNIVLAGTLFYRTSQYEARKRLGADLTTDDPYIPDHELKDFVVGESANDLLQAACRGAIRLSKAETCPEANLYIIASTKSGIENALPLIFPDAKSTPWLPIKLDLRGDSKKALKLLMSWKETAEAGAVFTFKELSSRLDISIRQLKDTVRRDTKFLRSIESEGLTAWGPRKYFVGYRLEDPLR